MIRVLKASGEYEPFSKEKVITSLERAGADKKIIDEVMNKLEPKLYDGIPTQKIYSHVFSFLKKFQMPLASKYNLKRAIMQLGPSGYPFERFIAGILEHKGYKTKVGMILEGKCIEHEIDITASIDSKNYIIECKFHNHPGTRSDIKVALYTYARYLDISELKNQKFGKAWLITNTKVTSEVKKYAKCIDLKVTSWNYPLKESLNQIIDSSGLHPLTCLNSLTKGEKRRLLEMGLVFCRDLLEKKVDFLPQSLLSKAQEEIKEICKTTTK